MAGDHIDAESLQLILELQRLDMSLVLKGKQRDGETTDTEVASKVYESELVSLATLNSDKVMCQSLARAVILDGDAIISHIEMEKQAEKDRQIALAWNNNKSDPSSSPPDINNAAPDAKRFKMTDEHICKLQALYLGEEGLSDLEEAESSTWAAKRAEMKTIQKSQRQCIACGDAFSFLQVVRCPCSHEYCQECLTALFQASTTDESLFPPRCCKKPIPIEFNQIFLPSSLVAKVLAKSIEFSAPQRTYCHMPTCSTFIPPKSIQGDIAHCPDCKRKTCTLCKGASHKADCPEDAATQEFLSTASSNGWKRCHQCHRFVELNTGCFHITCHCGAQFCYLCGVPWKKCMCPRWDERRLTDRANAVVDREARNVNVAPAQRQALVERARQDLLDNHECDHDRWRSIQGSSQCDECLHDMPQFIYQCRQCRILACRRCRFNRL